LSVASGVQGSIVNVSELFVKGIIGYLILSFGYKYYFHTLAAINKL